MTWGQLRTMADKSIELRHRLEAIKDTVIRTRNYDKAIRELNKLIGLYPSNIDILRLKGNILDLKASEISCASCDSAGDVFYDEALSCYEEILSLNPDNTVAHIDRAGYWLRKKEYDLAINDCDSAINALKNGNYFLSLSEELEEAYSCKIEILEELGKENEASAAKIELQKQMSLLSVSR